MGNRQMLNKKIYFTIFYIILLLGSTGTRANTNVHYSLPPKSGVIKPAQGEIVHTLLTNNQSLLPPEYGPHKYAGNLFSLGVQGLNNKAPHNQKVWANISVSKESNCYIELHMNGVYDILNPNNVNVTDVTIPWGYAITIIVIQPGTNVSILLQQNNRAEDYEFLFNVNLPNLTINSSLLVGQNPPNSTAYMTSVMNILGNPNHLNTIIGVVVLIIMIIVIWKLLRKFFQDPRYQTN